MIKVKDLHKNYGEKKVLEGINFEVEKGTIFALLGENGAGKTTTVRILSTLINQDKGQAEINGFDCKTNAKEVRKIISLTGQYVAVDNILTAEENLIMMGRLLGLSKKKAKERGKELLAQFDLTKVANKQVQTFSGGMRRRVDIAISLLVSPKVIFLDEPTTGLDPRSRMNMWELIKNLADSGVTIFLTTQYLEEAEQLADKIAVIHHGKIFVEGTASQLKKIVGEEKISLTFHQEKDVERAYNIVGGQCEEQRLHIGVTSETAAEMLRNTLNQLYEHRIEPSDVHLIKPTLDATLYNEVRQLNKKLAHNA